MLGLMLTVFACSFGSGESNKPQQNKTKDNAISEDMTSRRAVGGDFKVNVPKGTHTVVPADMGSDYNVYPANNGVMLQGIASGPIGNHSRHYCAAFLFPRRI